MPERQISPAVYGIETEYSHMIATAENGVYEIVGECHSADVELGLYAAPRESGTDQILSDELYLAAEGQGMKVNGRGFLSNGGRIYFDTSGVEYATPETTTAEEAVVRSFDGDEIVLGALEGLRHAEIIQSFQLNRRVVDHNRNSRGVHINTTTDLPASMEYDPEGVRHLATLNAAKGAIFGSGGLLINKDGQTEFHHSPRLSITDRLSSDGDDYEHRPLVRHEYKSDFSAISRIETVTGDALNFAWPLRASMVMTNAVVGLMELGLDDRLPLLASGSEVLYARLIGRNGNNCLVRLEQPGSSELRVASPLDVITMIAETALTVDSNEGFLDKEAHQVLPEIIETADMMANDLSSVADRVESVYRLLAMLRKMETDHLPLDSERMCRFDYAWDKVGGGIAETLRGKGRGWLGFKPGYIRRQQKQRLVPPQDTRARVRGNFIRDTEGTDNSDWPFVGNDKQFVKWLHPLTSEPPADMPTPRVGQKVGEAE